MRYTMHAVVRYITGTQEPGLGLDQHNPVTLEHTVPLLLKSTTTVINTNTPSITKW